MMASFTKLVNLSAALSVALILSARPLNYAHAHVMAHRVDRGAIDTDPILAWDPIASTWIIPNFTGLTPTTASSAAPTVTETVTVTLTGDAATTSHARLAARFPPHNVIWIDQPLVQNGTVLHLASVTTKHDTTTTEAATPPTDLEAAEKQAKAIISPTRQVLTTLTTSTAKAAATLCVGMPEFGATFLADFRRLSKRKPWHQALEDFIASGDYKAQG